MIIVTHTKASSDCSHDCRGSLLRLMSLPFSPSCSYPCSLLSISAGPLLPTLLSLSVVVLLWGSQSSWGGCPSKMTSAVAIVFTPPLSKS